MKTYLIAWRNLWRNRKRSFITIAAVLFAVFLSTFMTSMQEGTYSRMIDNTVSFYSGYMQVQDTGYWESKSINDIYTPNKKIINIIENTKNVSTYFPRLESFTLLSTGENTKGAAVIGIDPVKENEITHLSKWIIEGKYLKPGDNGILVAVNLAKQLKAKIGDTLILMSVGYHGASAAALFPIQGILKFPAPTLNNFGTYITLQQAQQFFSADGMVTSTVIMIDDYKKLNHTKKILSENLGKDYKVMTWEEMQPEIVQMIAQDRASGVIMKIILYTIIGFGIFGTVIMMMSERKRELAIMVAVGMKPVNLMKVIFFETLYIGLLGIFFGFLISTPIMAFFVHNPIPLPAKMGEVYEKFGFEAKMFFSLDIPIFLRQVAVVFAISVTVFIYPFISLLKFNLIKTLRG